MNFRIAIPMVVLAGVSSAALADCSDFLVAGKQYSVEYTTTTGPSEVGRVQRQMISGTRTTKEGACKKLVGTFAGSWAMTLTGCDSLEIVGLRSGDGNMTGQGTCTGGVATGSFGYVDARQQTYGYDFKITRQ